MRVRLTSTVFGLRNVRSAISRLVRPAAASLRDPLLGRGQAGGGHGGAGSGPVRRGPGRPTPGCRARSNVASASSSASRASRFSLRRRRIWPRTNSVRARSNGIGRPSKSASELWAAARRRRGRPAAPSSRARHRAAAASDHWPRGCRRLLLEAVEHLGGLGRARPRPTSASTRSLAWAQIRGSRMPAARLTCVEPAAGRPAPRRTGRGPSRSGRGEPGRPSSMPTVGSAAARSRHLRRGRARPRRAGRAWPAPPRGSRPPTGAAGAPDLLGPLDRLPGELARRRRTGRP